MKTNQNIMIAAFLAILLMIGAVVILNPKQNRSGLLPWDNPAHQGKVLIYFNKSKGSDIVTEPVTRKLPEPKPQTSQELVDYAMSELLKGPTDKEQDAGYFSEIPPGTKLISVNEEPKKITIDLSAEFTSGGGSNSMVQRLQEITKTVVSLPQKKPVYLTVKGKSLDVLGGEGIMVHEPITADPSLAQ